MKIKRTLPSISDKKDLKKKIRVSQESDDQIQPANFSSHVWMKREDEKKGEDLIIDKIMNSKRQIFQKNFKNQMKRESLVPENFGQKKKNDEQQEKNRSGQFLQQSHEITAKMIRGETTLSKNEEQIVEPHSKQNIIDQNELSRRSNSRSPRKRAIFKKKSKLIDSQDYQSSKMLSHDPNEENSQLLKKIESLQSVVKTLQDQVNASVMINSQNNFQNYPEQITPNLHKFLNENIYEKDPSVPQFRLSQEKKSSSRNSSRTKQYTPRDPKVIEMELNQMKRCQKITQENQRLYSRLRSSMNHSFSNNSYVSRGRRMDFQDYNINQDESSAINAKITQSKFQRPISHNTEIYSPFNLDENNKSAFFSNYCSIEDQEPTNFNQTIKVVLPKSMKLNKSGYQTIF